ncbi:MAG: serine/threonine protein kinase [Myxococcales bacterium]|nr:serine/threonine protein kinase [Myxococcales bacterium]
MQPADDALPVLGGRFQLIRPIGQGGFATVYQALDQRLDKNVAVKVLNQRFAAHEEYRKRFIQEAKAAARVSHPLLVDVSDIGGTDDGRLYFVMEYLEGCTLSEHLREHPGGLPWREAMVIALEIVKALEVAHRHDIVHRDVKPGNVFLKGGITRGPELQIKLLDLGIAKVHYEGRDEERPQTGTDGTPGTPEYMAPEQIRGGADSPSVDLYAVGVLTYRLLTGSLPFSAKTPWDVLAMHLNDEPPPILSRAPTRRSPPRSSRWSCVSCPRDQVTGRPARPRCGGGSSASSARTSGRPPPTRPRPGARPTSSSSASRPGSCAWCSRP